MTLSKEDKAEIAEMIAEVLGKETEPTEYKPWRPEVGEDYWEVDPLSVDNICKSECALRMTTDRKFDIGLAFRTEEEAYKKAEWLKALTILQEDTKGFKPNWDDSSQCKYQVIWDCVRLAIDCFMGTSHSIIAFATKEDAQESINKHEKEWRIFLGVEDETTK